jgi:hypothetical protein
MKKLILLTLAAVCVAQSAHAKKLVILTDQQSAAKAKDIQKLITSTTPFKLLNASEFSVEVHVIDAVAHPVHCAPKLIKYTDQEIESLKYYSEKSGIPISDAQLALYKKGYTIDRLVECDKAVLASLGAQFQADRVMFVHESNWEGGSGGDIPIILSGSRSGIGMHEWLHGYGLADEYAYSKEEAPFYCGQHQWANVAIFNEQAPYRSSDDVRTRHHDQIPFLPYIGEHAVLITGEELGSPKAGQLGIFVSRTCSNVVPKLQSWKSSSNPTIMEDPVSTYIPKPYWPAILSGLGVSSVRLASLMKTAVAPTWGDRTIMSPGNPPPTGL